MAKLKKMLVLDRSNTLQRVEKARRAAYARGFAVGLKRAGLLIQRESQKVVPVDTGNLIGSAFTRAEGQGLKTQVLVGYTANYAIYVHEILSSRHKAGKQAKFLEEPARRLLNDGTLSQVVRQSMGLS